MKELLWTTVASGGAVALGKIVGPAILRATVGHYWRRWLDRRHADRRGE